MPSNEQNKTTFLHDASLAESFYSKYDAKEILGTGASSTVRLCTRKDTQTNHAVKIIDINSGVESADLIRSECMREVDILQKVAGHPNIIQLLDVFEGDSCPGGELFDYLTRNVTLSEKKTRPIMRQILDAVKHIHNCGIVHRDLKPENILLDDKLNVKITDFGLAVFNDDVAELKETRGTPGYLAPEVLKVGYYENQPPYGPPVDLWACGVIMYTLLVGCPPFWNRKEHLMLRQIMQGKFSFPSPEWDDISDTTKDLIKKLLVVDVEQRVLPKLALGHEFFAQTAFVAFIMLSFIWKLKQLHLAGIFVSVEQLTLDPYSHRRMRKIIDTMSFDVYGQWVKKGEEQNRAALFENCPRRDLLIHQRTSDSDETCYSPDLLRSSEYDSMDLEFTGAEGDLFG